MKYKFEIKINIPDSELEDLWGDVEGLNAEESIANTMKVDIENSFNRYIEGFSIDYIKPIF